MIGGMLGVHGSAALRLLRSGDIIGGRAGGDVKVFPQIKSRGVKTSYSIFDCRSTSSSEPIRALAYHDQKLLKAYTNQCSVMENRIWLLIQGFRCWLRFEKPITKLRLRRKDFSIAPSPEKTSKLRRSWVGYLWFHQI